MIARRASAVLLAGLAAWTLAAPLPARADDAYNLRRVYKAGETDKYRTIITLESANTTGGDVRKMELSLMTTETTKEVKDDGAVVIAISVDEGTAKVNGSEKPLPGTPVTFTTTYDKGGNMLKQEGGGGPLAMIGSLIITAQMNLTLDRPLKIGEASKFETPGGEKREKATAVITLVSLEKKNDEIPVDTLKIKSVTDSPAPASQGGQKVHAEAIAFIEPGTGKPFKTEGTVTGVKFGPTDVKISFKRVRVNEKESK